jgi:transposase
VSGFWVAPGQAPPAIPRGFQVVPTRWIVERTLAWRGQDRRLSTAYERLPATRETLVDAAMSRFMLRRRVRQRAAPARYHVQNFSESF